MRGYNRIPEGASPGESDAQGAREEGNVRTPLRSSSGSAAEGQGGETRNRRLAVAVPLGVLGVLGVLLITSGGGGRRLRPEPEAGSPASFESQHSVAGVSVFESSFHDGTRLDQGFPAPASLKQVIAVCAERGVSGTVVVESDDKLQEIIGFGGAFTDAATINFFKLPEDVQEQVLDAYFGPNGIEYSVGRIPMGSCDFSVEQYSFDEVPGDYNLTHFDDGVEKDTAQRIPMLLSALARREDLKLFTSPWSPPAWMKEPKDGVQSMIESALPQGLLADPGVHAAWALFFSRFISAYKEQGVDLWGLTIQNESENPGPWEACVYTPSSQAKFIRDHLGPVIRRDHPDVKIMAFDHNRDHLVTWAEEMMSNEETAQYVDGMAFHWYVASWNRLLDGSMGWGALNTTHNLLSGRDKFILSTESCNCPNVDHSLEGGWKRAEHTLHEMIADVNSWSTGWVDWNLMLSYDGGPNHAGNLCDTPIVSNENHTDVIFQPMFYSIGHMSKFAQPGARRLKSHVTGLYQNGGSGPSTALAGYEATLYGCEGSVRQSWEMSATGRISLADNFGAQYDWFQPLCLSKDISESFKSVNLVPCDSDQAGTFVYDQDSGRIALQADASSPPDADPQTVADAEDPVVSGSTESVCLDVLDGSTDDGVVLTLNPCDLESTSEDTSSGQRWEFAEAKSGDGGGGSLVSAATGRCMTAGWPFFTGAAFEMSDASKDRYGKDYAVVLLNEAEEPVEFDLSFPSEGFSVRAIIGPRAIQTILA
ncbi:Glucosylceramidase, family GH30 [Ectocarpus siliculosus]|uniref:Glucosylceramidase, family GH30 n=1 Tax=Ectocarpus siliculosus TaxID=2880 RepID=D8LFH3_ECTSI|nr:Glucosylceramidase, family GH30 [Ectocarpus siliculosus]|eukprot:CBN79893.1 Glucosylceramidase, family GH30 [Ectocarpus siliculosus]